MGGIGVVTNPRSRRNRRNPGLQHQLAYVLGEQGQLAAPTDLDGLRSAMVRFKERRIDVLAINGGDGTSHVVFSTMLSVYQDTPMPAVALLRGGTMNTVASGLGIRGRPQALLGRLVEQYHSGEPFRVAERNLIVVGEHAGFLFGNGLLSHFLEVYYDSDDPNPARAVWLLVRAGASALVGGKFIRHLFRPVRAQVTVGPWRWTQGTWMTIAAGTVDDIGLGFRPFYRCLDHPGYMHAVGVACGPMALIGQLPNIWRARPIEHPDVVDAVADRMVIEADEPLSYMLDGDFHVGGQRLEVTIGPRVRLIVV
ncbi:MAG: diacylglycerol kinase [Alphaproteobacteria bacterium]|nr:diacylglycerol kinase [Alphaproteobacteria bacterium]